MVDNLVDYYKPISGISYLKSALIICWTWFIIW